MEFYKCDVCVKSFTGLVCYQQHEASEKHKKKIQMMNGTISEIPKPVSPDQYHCPVCMVSILGLDNYQKHVISLDHALKVQKKNGDLLSQSLSGTFELKSERSQLMGNTVPLTSSVKAVAPFAECKPCQKQFSGPEPYQQHLVSAGHKKKCGYSNEIMQSNETSFSVGNEKINNNSLNEPQSSVSEGDLKNIAPQLMDSPISLTSSMKVIAPFAECKPCQKQFTGLEPYQQHLASAGHKKKCVSSNEIIQCNKADLSVGNECINIHSLYDPQSSSSEDDLNKMAPQTIYKCDICEMEFSEALLYHIHLGSEDHKKQAAEQLFENSFSESQSAYKCDICVMRFSGPVPFKQHLASNGHDKKMKAAKYLSITGPLPPPDSTLKDNYVDLEQSSMYDLQKWYCNICKKQCSGPIPFRSHISSRDHSRILRALQIEENLRKESSPLARFGNDENDSSLSSQVTSTADLYSKFKSEKEESFKLKINDLNINVKSEDTKILSDKFQTNASDLLALSNLNIIPPEKLDVSVFRPDDEIIFSSPKKSRQHFLSDMNEVNKECHKEKFSENSCLMVE